MLRKFRSSALCLSLLGVCAGLPVVATAAVTAQSAEQTDNPLDWVSAQVAHLKEDYGIGLKFNYQAVVLGNPVGGISHKASYTHLIDFGATFDFAKIAQIEGGKLVISARQGAGTAPKFIGNIFDVSQADVRHGVYLTALYWEQTLADRVVVVQVGRMHSGSVFASLPAFGLQVNGGVDGNPQSLSMNSAFTSGSYNVWGGNVKVTPDEAFYVTGGIYQATDSVRNNHGFDFSIRRSDRLLFLAQAGWTPTFLEADAAEAVQPGQGAAHGEGLPGHYAIGSYYSNKPYERFDGTGPVHDTYGFYLMAQQMVWRSASNANQNVSLWGGMTYSPQTEVAKMPLMGFAGVVVQGLIAGRDQDKLLGAVLVGSLSSDYADSQAGGTYGRPGNTEVVLDFSYIIQLTQQAFIQPDIQYVINPGGYSTISNALVVGMQFGVRF